MKIDHRVRSISRKFTSSITISKLTVSLGAFLALMGMFGYIAKQVYEGDTATRDTEILLKINSHSSSLYDFLALTITYSGNILSVVMLLLILLFILYKRRQFRMIVQVLFSVGGAVAANALLKLLFQRDRPELWQLITHESTYSFPSGHALITAALATTVVILWWRSKYRRYIVIVAALYTILVGLSRLYLGVHFPSDVVAGWCYGVAWAIIVALIMRTIVVRTKTT